VSPKRNLVPYLLVGVLTLGAGLGVGLGVSQGSVTSTGDQVAPEVNKAAVRAHDKVNPVGTFKHFFENTSVSIPVGYAACQSTGHKTRLVRLGSAAFKKAIAQADQSCTWRIAPG
jgi:hypothetical protein